jgi:restriction endonuclease Mrr
VIPVFDQNPPAAPLAWSGPGLTAFVGKAEGAEPSEPLLRLEAVDGLARMLGAADSSELPSAVRAFFEAGGRECLVAARGGPRSGDGGIDGIIKEDKLGLDVVYIQAKRWEGPVSRPTVQGFAGSLEGQRARKGVLITTSQFTAEAKDYVNRIEKKIILIDGEMLAQLMIEHNVGVTTADTYHVKKPDLDFFEEGN